MGLGRAPHVLLLGSVLGQPVGGVWRHNRELLPRAARLLGADGGSLTVLEGREPCAFELPEAVRRIQAHVPARPPLRRALAEGHALRRLLAERSFDLVHTAHQPVPRGFDSPLSLLVHDLRHLDLEHSPFSRRLVTRELLGRAVRRAAVLSTVSQATAAVLREVLGLGEAPIHVVPNAADHFEPLPRTAAADAPLLCVGHLEPRKNAALPIEALALDAGLPPVHFAGAAKGSEQERLEARAAQLGVGGRVRFLGSVSDEELLGLYAAAAAVVLPSRLEGFGIPVLEAQRCGAPVAVSAVPAHLEVAAPDTPSFAPDDAAGCARAIRAALARTESELRAARADGERYRWERSAELLVRAWRAGADAGAQSSSS